MILFALHGFLQALSISRSLAEAKVAAENGQVNCRELRNSFVQAVQEAGGAIDYAEVRHPTLSLSYVHIELLVLVISGFLVKLNQIIGLLSLVVSRYVKYIFSGILV